METFDNIEELKFPQEYEDGGIIILDDLNEKEMNDPRVQAMFKRSRHKKIIYFYNQSRLLRITKTNDESKGKYLSHI